MANVRILKNHEYRIPGRRAMLSFKADPTPIVTRREFADDLIKLGVAEEVKETGKRPTKAGDPPVFTDQRNDDPAREGNDQ